MRSYQWKEEYITSFLYRSLLLTHEQKKNIRNYHKFIKITVKGIYHISIKITKQACNCGKWKR